jgi:hypothetical protein
VNQDASITVRSVKGIVPPEKFYRPIWSLFLLNSPRDSDQNDIKMYSRKMNRWRHLIFWSYWYEMN